MPDPIADGTPIHVLRKQIERGEVSAEELVRFSLERIERLDPELRAFIQVRGEEALQEARQKDCHPRPFTAPPLWGIPMSVKDLMDTRELPTTAGSRVFGDGLHSGRDATLVHRLRRAGAILLGKTNLHEFAYGVTTENSHFGTARNPWDQSRLAGGSSGGSGVAVAAGMGCFAIGTDTRGSIRIPSSFCGITGLKPTLGSVSTRGIIPLSRTLDHAGPMTRSVADAETVFRVIRNPDGRRTPRILPRRLRIGLADFFLDPVEAEVRDPILRAIDELAGMGHHICRVEVPELEESVDASRVIASAEAVACHEPWIARNRAGYDPAVLARLELGFQVPAIDLVRAYQLRKRLQASLRRVFRSVDCLAGASVPALPGPVSAAKKDLGTRLEQVARLIRLNAPLNVSGTPALVLPCGFASGLPVSLQLIASWHREDVLFALGGQFQEHTDWHRRRPPV